MDDIIIDIKGLTKTFKMGHIQYGFKNMLLHLPMYIKSRTQAKTFVALDNINLSIKRGERVGLIGHNGCGKTTLLSVIGGVYKDYKGICDVRGRCSMMLALGAGFCSQLSGRENIMLNGVLQGKTRKEMKALEEEIVDFAEIGEYIDAPVYQYSSGMMARLGFGIATAIDPEILLVDEVMAVGDSSFASKCEVRINNVLKNGTTLILVSHNHADIEKYCNRVIKIDHGKVVEDMKRYLMPKALEELADAQIREHSDFVYADEFMWHIATMELTEIRKKSFAMEDLERVNSINHPALIRKELLEEAGSFRDGFEGSQDHDLYLRVCEKTEKISYVPKLLYVWRINPGSFSERHLDVCIDSGRRAVQEHLERMNIPGKVVAESASPRYSIVYGKK